MIVSLYAASPTYRDWQPEFEAEFMSAVFDLESVTGFELPWLQQLHPHDVPWLMQHLPTGAELVLTPLPWVMQQQARIPGYGLASTDPNGRAAAIDDLRLLAADIRELHAASSARVSGVMLHSAPSLTGTAEALRASLAELTQWDWSGAQLAIEHCDAARPGQSAEKGFLDIDDEIAACLDSNGAVGIWLNWGRSAIERRGADAVADQIALVAQAGVLTGLTFSGAADGDGPYGQAWTDAHLPFDEVEPAAGSLLTVTQFERALDATGDGVQLGLKASRRLADQTPADIAAGLAAQLELIARATYRERRPS